MKAVQGLHRLDERVVGEKRRAFARARLRWMFATRRGWVAWAIWGALAVLLAQFLPWAPWQFAVLLPAYLLIAGLLGMPPDTARPARRDD